jgi:hypothetical protein
VDIATPKPTLQRFMQLETRLEDLLLGHSTLSEQESKRKNEELQKRLRTRFGPGPMKSPGWEFTYVVDEETKASVFTEEELEAWLAPSKELVSIERDIDAAEAEINGFCSQLPFHDVVFGSERYTFGEWFVQKLRRRGHSSTDAGEYLSLRNRVVAHLADSGGTQQPTSVPQDRYPLFPKVRPRGRVSGRAWDIAVRRWDKNGPPLMSVRKITQEINDHRDPADRTQYPSGEISDSVVSRLLTGKCP